MSSAAALLAQFGGVGSAAVSLPQEVELALKGVSKKDDATKEKGYRKLLVYVNNTIDLTELLNVFTTIPFPRLWLEGSRVPAVRQLLASVLGECVVKLGKQATPGLQTSSSAVWLLLLLDESAVVAQTAKGLFNKVFTTVDKRRAFMKLVRSKQGHFLEGLLSYTEASLADYLGVTKDEAHEERFDRVISTAVRALTDLSQTLDRHEKLSHSDILFDSNLLNKRSKIKEAVQTAYLAYLATFPEQNLVVDDYDCGEKSEKVIKRLFTVNDNFYKIEILKLLCQQERYVKALQRIYYKGKADSIWGNVFPKDSYEDPDFMKKVSQCVVDGIPLGRVYMVALSQLLDDFDGYYTFLAECQKSESNTLERTEFVKYLIRPVVDKYLIKNEEDATEGSKNATQNKAREPTSAEPSRIVQPKMGTGLTPFAFWRRFQRTDWPAENDIETHMSKTLLGEQSGQKSGDKSGPTSTFLSSNYVKTVEFLLKEYKTFGTQVLSQIWPAAIHKSAQAKGDLMITVEAGGEIPDLIFVQTVQQVAQAKPRKEAIVGEISGGDVLASLAQSVLNLDGTMLKGWYENAEEIEAVMKEFLIKLGVGDRVDTHKMFVIVQLLAVAVLLRSNASCSGILNSSQQEIGSILKQVSKQIESGNLIRNQTKAENSELCRGLTRFVLMIQTGYTDTELSSGDKDLDLSIDIFRSVFSNTTWEIEQKYVQEVLTYAKNDYAKNALFLKSLAQRLFEVECKSLQRNNVAHRLFVLKETLAKRGEDSSIDMLLSKWESTLVKYYYHENAGNFFKNELDNWSSEFAATTTTLTEKIATPESSGNAESNSTDGTDYYTLDKLLLQYVRDYPEVMLPFVCTEKGFRENYCLLFDDLVRRNSEEVLETWLENYGRANLGDVELLIETFLSFNKLFCRKCRRLQNILQQNDSKRVGYPGNTLGVKLNSYRKGQPAQQQQNGEQSASTPSGVISPRGIQSEEIVQRCVGIDTEVTAQVLTAEFSCPCCDDSVGQEEEPEDAGLFERFIAKSVKSDATPSSFGIICNNLAKDGEKSSTNVAVTWQFLKTNVMLAGSDWHVGDVEQRKQAAVNRGNASPSSLEASPNDSNIDASRLFGTKIRDFSDVATFLHFCKALRSYQENNVNPCTIPVSCARLGMPLELLEEIGPKVVFRDLPLFSENNFADEHKGIGTEKLAKQLLSQYNFKYACAILRSPGVRDFCMGPLEDLIVDNYAEFEMYCYEHGEMEALALYFCPINNPRFNTVIKRVIARRNSTCDSPRVVWTPEILRESLDKLRGFLLSSVEESRLVRFFSVGESQMFTSAQVTTFEPKGADFKLSEVETWYQWVWKNVGVSVMRGGTKYRPVFEFENIIIAASEIEKQVAKDAYGVLANGTGSPLLIANKLRLVALLESFLHSSERRVTSEDDNSPVKKKKKAWDSSASEPRSDFILQEVESPPKAGARKGATNEEEEEESDSDEILAEGESAPRQSAAAGKESALVALLELRLPQTPVVTEAHFLLIGQVLGSMKKKVVGKFPDVLSKVERKVRAFLPNQGSVFVLGSMPPKDNRIIWRTLFDLFMSDDCRILGKENMLEIVKSYYGEQSFYYNSDLTSVGNQLMGKEQLLQFSIAEGNAATLPASSSLRTICHPNVSFCDNLVEMVVFEDDFRRGMVAVGFNAFGKQFSSGNFIHKEILQFITAEMQGNSSTRSFIDDSMQVLLNQKLVLPILNGSTLSTGSTAKPPSSPTAVSDFLAGGYDPLVIRKLVGAIPMDKTSDETTLGVKMLHLMVDSQIGSDDARVWLLPAITRLAGLPNTIAESLIAWLVKRFERRSQRRIASSKKDEVIHSVLTRENDVLQREEAAVENAFILEIWQLIFKKLKKEQGYGTGAKEHTYRLTQSIEDYHQGYQEQVQRLKEVDDQVKNATVCKPCVDANAASNDGKSSPRDDVEETFEWKLLFPKCILYQLYEGLFLSLSNNLSALGIGSTGKYDELIESLAIHTEISDGGHDTSVSKSRSGRLKFLADLYIDICSSSFFVTGYQQYRTDSVTTFTTGRQSKALIARWRALDEWYTSNLMLVFLKAQVTRAKSLLTANDIEGKHDISAKFRLLKSAKQISLDIQKDELEAQLNFQFVDNYPIGPVDVRNSTVRTWTLLDANENLYARKDGQIFGVPIAQFRKWELATRAAENINFPTLVFQWLQSFGTHFEGVGDCMICYAVIHAVSGSIPRKACPTCKQYFHAECVRQWFATSGKTLCPLCKQPFL